MNNLWGDFSEILTFQTPSSIIKEQIAFFNNRFGDRIISKLELMETRSMAESTIENKSILFYDFYLSAVFMRTYKYSIFTMRHDLKIYPLKLEIENDIFSEIFDDLNNIIGFGDIYGSFNEYELDNGNELVIYEEGDFIHCLSLILKSESIENIISSILSIENSF